MGGVEESAGGGGACRDGGNDEVEAGGIGVAASGRRCDRSAKSFSRLVRRRCSNCVVIPLASMLSLGGSGGASPGYRAFAIVENTAVVGNSDEGQDSVPSRLGRGKAVSTRVQKGTSGRKAVDAE